MCAAKTLFVVLAAGILIVGANVVHATPIDITNPSFLSPDIGPLVGGIGAPPSSWNFAIGSMGIYTIGNNNPAYAYTYGTATDSDWFNSAPPNGGVATDGNGHSYFHIVGSGGSSGVYQVLLETLQANTTYTLQVDGGQRAGLDWGGSASVGLGYGEGSGFGTNLLTPTTSLTLTNGVNLNDASWGVAQATFVTGANPEGLNQRLRIDVSFSAQVCATNVRLDATPAPEPSTIVLLATGLLGLLCYGWRKRK